VSSTRESTNSPGRKKKKNTPGGTGEKATGWRLKGNSIEQGWGLHCKWENNDKEKKRRLKEGGVIGQTREGGSNTVGEREKTGGAGGDRTGWVGVTGGGCAGAGDAGKRSGVGPHEQKGVDQM